MQGQAGRVVRTFLRLYCCLRCKELIEVESRTEKAKYVPEQY